MMKSDARSATVPTAADPASGHPLDEGDTAATHDETTARGAMVLNLGQDWRRARSRRHPRAERDLEHDEQRAFNPEEIAILSSAFAEACAFLRRDGELGPAKRQEIAHLILSHARRGHLDAHRLAVKAIVHVA